MKTLGVLLAAGASRRFGVEDKLLAPWRGGVLVGASAALMAQAGCDHLAAIVSSESVAAALPAAFDVVRIAPGQEMSVSFRAACRHAETLGAQRLLIALGDMPGLRVATLQRLLDGAQSGACQFEGARMPPALLLPADWQTALSDKADQGARATLRALPETALIPLTAAEAQDIDTRADLDQARQGDG
ncbi:nucleotidyltransferase family protein [Phaeovulum sp.]|uniref:nucleotidyltransferase family protein n=1 Tax=Phaeovulum sp. TaxID=2934796 RepID=UPI0039E6A784